MSALQVGVDPAWLAAARRDIGLAEIPGVATQPRIRRMLIAVGAAWRDDETPWCGTAMGAWMLEAGQQPPVAPWRALNWATWGRPVTTMVVGSVAVFRRGPGLGHVAIAVGRTGDGRILCIGANQRDRVSVAPFNPYRLESVRWPGDAIGLLGRAEPLPLLQFDGPSSTQEG